MLLLSTMVISPAAFVANAAEQYGITINHIFSDGYKADDSYDELYGTFEEGETPLVSIVAPYGYIIENVYFTSPAGEDFALFIEDLEYDNPVSGIYHITMPDYALTMSVVYRCVLNTVVINHIYDGGHCEDDDYQIVIGEDQIAGSVVNFTADPKAGYAIDTMYVLAYAGTSFSNLVDLDIVKVGENTYRFVMPIEPITVNIVYTPIRNSITPVALFDGQQSSNSELYYNGPLTADPGDVVIFYGAEINDYSVPEAFATAGAGSAFVEVIELQEAAGAYYFIMPDTDVTVTLVYSNTRFGITASNIFEDGTEDNTVYYNGADTAVVGERVVFTIDAPQGYAVSEIFGVYSAGSAFVEVFPIDTLAGTYYFDMPDGEVAITIVYTATLFDINFVSYKGTQIDNQWTVADVAAGSTFVFAGNAPAGYAVEDVFALSKVSDTFVEIIPVDDLGNGSYAFEMPAANVDVAIVYKSVLFNVNYASYAGEQLVAEWTDEGIMVGDNHIFAVDAPEGYAVEDVIATTTVNRLFVEVLNVGNLAGAYYFTMPAGDVDVTVILKKITFEVTVNDVVEGQTVKSVASANDAGDTVIVIANAPEGYENGYIVKSISAVSAADDTVEYVLNQAGSNVYSFEMPEGDVVVNIEWKANMFDVTVSNVDENGTLLSSREINNVPAGSDVNVAFEAPGEDYIAVEYYVVAEVAPFYEFINATLVGDAMITFVQPEADVDVTVVWRRNAYTVTERYIVNDTEVIDELTAEWEVRPGDNWISMLTLPEGYEVSEIFVTAMDGAFGEPLDYVVLNENAILFIVPDGDVFVDYYLKKIVNTVNYYAYVDGVLTVVKSEEVEYGEKALWGKDNAAAALSDGHAFIGWYNGAAAYDFDAALTTDLNLFAVYEFVNYTVSFNSDGGSEVASQTVVKNGKAVAPAAPEKEGYDFAGWQLNGAAYDFDSAVTGNIELTATWTAKTYTVYLPEGEGYTVAAAEGSATTVAYGGSFSFTVAYDTGVNSDGAVVTANGVALTADNGVYTVADVKSDVYVAVSGVGSSKLCTVKFNYFSGAESISVAFNVEYGGSVTAPVDTYRYTYNFLGWFDNAAGEGEAVTDFTNVVADAEYFAVYAQNPVADYSFGEYTVADSTYGMGFKEVKIEVLKNNAEYQDRDVFVIAAAQLKDGSTILFYIPVFVENGESKADVSVILNSATFEYVDMYIVYDEVDLSGSLTWIDIEAGIEIA